MYLRTGLTYVAREQEQVAYMVGAGWQDVDLSAVVPLTARGVCILLWNDTTNDDYAGVRCKGDTTDNKSYYRNGQTIRYAVPITSERIIQVYKGTEFGARYFIVGYYF